MYEFWYTQNTHTMNMKPTLLALLLPLFGLAQSENPAPPATVLMQDSVPQTSLFLKDRRIVFQKVFSSQLNKDELMEKLNGLLSNTRGFRFDRHVYFGDGEFFGWLYGHRFDYIKYNLGILGTPSLLGQPMYAKVAIQVKDNKYRVTITEMSFSVEVDPREMPNNTLLDEWLTEKRRSRLSKSRSSVKLATYLNQDLSDLFDLSKSVTYGDF